MQIPEISAVDLFDPSSRGYQESLVKVRVAAEDIGFMTLTDTCLGEDDVRRVLSAYRDFFTLPTARKAEFNMANTGSNRGWGASGAEQVDPASNPDFKEVFDCGLELPPGDPLARHTYYAPNRWPTEPAGFRENITDYYTRATRISLDLLSAIASSIDEPADYFRDKFDKPMALLRGNYYPSRPLDATERDFGIAPHTDYGCLTLLAMDGSPGLEVATRSGDWVPVTANPGTFVINFGEMLQMWSNGRIVATPHRVIGGAEERMSVPFFFNPRADVNVAPWGSAEVRLAGEHLSRRYDETYVHRQPASGAG
ncbi:isopenicillin N synthase family dioxygenase [Granulosicoccus sp. 3-233]|uniref:isopenicillin N synthase family dioxygenase n=1 Tax=Granulosicoccus sp. 3-233 TaxID=3417969 RepID=UPI003D352ADA